MPSGKLFVLVVTETKDQTPEQATVLNSKAARDLMAAKSWQWRIVDQDVKDENGKPPADIGKWIEQAKTWAAAGNKLPCLMILDEQGEVVGEHDGAYAFTVGQRKGLRLPRPAPDGQPRYVREVDVERNVVVVAPAELLGVRRLDGEHVRWCGDAPTGPTRLGAQVRAHGAELPATAYPGVGPDGSPALEVVLDQPLRGVAPGQSVVLYAGTRVVGSATIRATHPR